MRLSLIIPIMSALIGCSHPAASVESPDQAVRGMLKANEQRSINELIPRLSKDPDLIAYSIGGRKYVGWEELVRQMQQEFEATTRIEIPIKDLQVWERGDLAWYIVEIDYIRHERDGSDERRTVLPLRESGVLERQDGRWRLLQIHESLAGSMQMARSGEKADDGSAAGADPGVTERVGLNLAGVWEIHEEERSYRAVLDSAGHGTYGWQDGRITTVRLVDGTWEGTWHQPGNDREGGFEVYLSEDRQAALGRWWYTRVGARHVPPRQWGGEYRLRRLQP